MQWCAVASAARGDAFNLGETTVTRATLRLTLDDGSTPVGVALHMGRDKERARLAAFALLLALTDYLTPVFLAREDRMFGDALRFHASAPVTQDRVEASFVYIDDVASMPSLAVFSQGQPETPEDSATLFIRVPSLNEGEPLVWRGPGIDGERTVRIAGLSREFWRERAALTAHFPCGIDCYFVAGASLVGLPRTTLVEVN